MGRLTFHSIEDQYMSKENRMQTKGVFSMMTTYCLVIIVLVAQAKVCCFYEIEILVDIV